MGAAVASARGVFALARDRRIPGAMAAVSTRGTPVGAIVFVAAVSLVMVALAEFATTCSRRRRVGPHFFEMFAWLSTFGALRDHGRVRPDGARRRSGVSRDHPNQVAVWIAGIIGTLIAVRRVYGGICKDQVAPNNLVWRVVARLGGPRADRDARGDGAASRRARRSPTCDSEGNVASGRMTGPDERPLRLDAPREEVLQHAAALVGDAWRSFDRFRPEEPPLDERIRRCSAPGCPTTRCPRTRRSTTRRGSSTNRSRSRGRGTSRSSGPRASRSGRSPTCSRTPTTSTSRSTPARPR